MTDDNHDNAPLLDADALAIDCARDAVLHADPTEGWLADRPGPDERERLTDHLGGEPDAETLRVFEQTYRRAVCEPCWRVESPHGWVAHLHPEDVCMVLETAQQYELPDPTPVFDTKVDPGEPGEVGALWIVKGTRYSREWGRGNSETVKGHHDITRREATQRAAGELSHKYRPPSESSRTIYRAVFRPADAELTPEGDLRAANLGEINTDLWER